MKVTSGAALTRSIHGSTPADCSWTQRTEGGSSPRSASVAIQTIASASSKPATAPAARLDGAREVGLFMRDRCGWRVSDQVRLPRLLGEKGIRDASS